MNIRCLDCGAIVRKGDDGPCPPGCPRCGGARIEGDEDEDGKPRGVFEALVVKAEVDDRIAAMEKEGRIG